MSVTITNRKSHTGFRLDVLTSVTLNDLKRLNSFHFAFAEFDRFGTDYVTVVEDKTIMSAKYPPPVIFGQN